MTNKLRAEIKKAAKALEGYQEYSWGWRVASEKLAKLLEKRQSVCRKAS